MRDPGNKKEVKLKKVQKRQSGHGISKCDMKGRSYKRLRASSNTLSTSIKSEDIFQEMKVEHPVLVRSLVRSNVSGCFWMGLPQSFCRKYMPKNNVVMVLETESGDCYKVKYLAGRTAFSGGWRGLAIAQKLKTGDVIAFHVGSAKIKVQITRMNQSAALLPVADVKVENSDQEQVIVYRRRKLHQPLGKSGRKSQSIFSESITSFGAFKRAINEMINSHELHESSLRTYYELCCSQKTFLQTNLLKGINTSVVHANFVKQILSETIIIANALTTCDTSTFIHEFELWNQTLKTYNALGMNVKFLIIRLCFLQDLACNCEGAMAQRQWKEASNERSRAENEVRKLEPMVAKLNKFCEMLGAHIETSEAREPGKRCIELRSQLARAENERGEVEALLIELRKFFNWYGAEIEYLKLKADGHENEFQERARAPW